MIRTTIRIGAAHYDMTSKSLDTGEVRSVDLAAFFWGKRHAELRQAQHALSDTICSLHGIVRKPEPSKERKKPKETRPRRRTPVRHGPQGVPMQDLGVM